MSRAAPHRRSRRVIIILLVTAALCAGLAVRGWVDTTRPRLRGVGREAGVTRELRVLHVSDLHARRFGAHQAGLERILRGVHADVALITGDMIVAGRDELGPALELVAVLRRHASLLVFVPGNHDDAQVASALERHRVRLVEPGEVISIPGRGDVAIVSADRAGAITAAPARAAPLLIVAMHQPPGERTLRAARRLTTGTQLLLAGHTHGGQLRMPWVGALIAPVSWDEVETGGSMLELFPDLRGFLVVGEEHAGDQWVSVSTGLGETLLPFRLFDRAEITLFTVRPRR